MKSEEAIKQFEIMFTPKTRGKGPSTFRQHLHYLISEHYYPKEFVEWILAQEIFFGELSEEYILNDNPGRFKSIDELFNYWEENEI